MTMTQDNLAPTGQEQWLKHYYFARTVFSAAWVAAAFTVGRQSPTIGTILLVAYPAWDALANYIDASRSGGLGRNRTQAINVAVSVATTLAVILALTMSMNWVIGVFGVWAILSGLLQLGTALRRWKSSGAQWAMILSGAQSALAGTFFIVQSQMPMPPSIANIAGYAAVGALYFLISAVWLTVSQSRRKAA
ncbi:DUF308 domain-containing protein [Ancylobacter dichloromethanicus]|uniref:Membrane protein n=1 Tax=Ancylobacter dichloromethanicus TaxID=518825 RepID=A0A9W6JD05_9HYPH|nr:DUF308 domain-containing protein [Ancylobacter dichloromethanicus]MBS7554948.1 DUF308 domain-containing protein [Ancylobacter dichloromethanicus]GLK73343.1 membrane protein [Ancylobacter dichloromethanicus]